MLFHYSIQEIALLVPCVLLALMLHELAHGWAAYLLGDETAKEAGRLSFNPLRHLDPIGTLCMLLAGVGWAKPVPVNPNRFHIRNRKFGVALTGAAGPLCNFILAFVSLLAYGVWMIRSGGEMPQSAVTALTMFAGLNIGLGAFNLIPVPPLDGSRILLPFLPDKAALFLHRYERYIGMVFFLLLITDLLDGPIGAVRGAIADRIVALAFGLARLLGGAA
ncbi:MAG: site-2 protease family protein [Clostridia bacterium]|nr:site-2 protease family protein [Clostridia bacterium]